ncbi:AraC family transcriptional regulator [Burkholderia sp. F1]|uniref:AraC family transcriptional regulator n=1 Tax=Burkholderia sp. F1 TaxID=3366817 RepID=UPI003D721318
MANWDFPRSVIGLRLLIETGAAHGLSTRQCLAGTGVRERDLCDPAGVVVAEQELAVIRNLVERLPGVNALGIDAGRRYHYTAFGILGFAIVSSANARGALDVALRYFNLTFAFSRFEVTDTPIDTVIEVDTSAVPEDLRRFVAERDTAAVATVQRELVADLHALRRIEFAFPPPRDDAPYREAYGVTPRFGAPRTIAVLDRAKLQLPLPQANELVRRLSEEQCVQLLMRNRSHVGVASKVRAQLARDIGADMEAVATLLCTTSRTLRRQLAAEGTSFGTIRNETITALAEEYLVSLKLPVQEVAERLGYASASAFITAFTRLMGETPLAYRKRVEMMHT